MTGSGFLDDYGSEIVDFFAETVDYIAPDPDDYLQDSIASRGWTNARIWCVLTSLTSRRDSIARRDIGRGTVWTAAVAKLETLGQTYHPRPATVPELLDLVDELVRYSGPDSVLWGLTAEGALLALSDSVRAQDPGDLAVRDALSVLADLRDFVHDLYHEVAERRLRATLREVRALFGA